MTVRPDDDGEFLTAAELIEKLQAFPPNTPVAIGDADTEWDLDLTDVELASDEEGPFVRLKGSYY